MIERLKDSFWRLRGRLRRRRGRRRGNIVPVLRGNMRSVIVVKPDNAMFSEALFVLSDEYLRRCDLPAKELLRQAEEAAGGYCEVPGNCRRGIPLVSCVLLVGALGGCIVLMLRFMMG